MGDVAAPGDTTTTTTTTAPAAEAEDDGWDGNVGLELTVLAGVQGSCRRDDAGRRHVDRQ